MRKAIASLLLLTASSVFASVMLPMPDSVPLSQPAHVDVRVDGDAVQGHILRRESEQKEAEQKNPSLSRSDDPLKDSDAMELPAPILIPGKTKTLSLNEAIALALRYNPNVKTAELTRISDKFALEMAIHDNYGVQWSPITAKGSLANGSKPSFATGTGIGVTALSGTNVAVGYANNLQGGSGVNTVTITQPLLQGFGVAFNRIAYDNAVVNEAVAKMTFKNNVITVVVGVVTNYRALVQAYENLVVSKQSLASQEVSTNQTKLQVKVGQMAPSDLLQQQANLESTRLSVVQQEDALRDAYQAFLTSIGLVPSAKVVIDQTITLDDRTKIPSRQECVEIALKNNIAYQSAVLQLENTKRALISAENTKKWQLGVSSTTVVGYQNTGAGIADQYSPPNLTVNLSIPFDNVDNQAGVVNAKIAIENAKLALEQQKENLERQVIDQWESIQNQYQQILISQLSVQMQQKTLDNTKLQLKYGKATVFEVNTLENNLLSAQFSLIGTEISYLNAITTLNQTLATTLDRRHVKLRY